MKIWLYTEFWEIRVLSSHPPALLPPSLEGVFPSLPRILCLTQVTVIEASARLKLVWSRLAVYISFIFRHKFPGEHHAKLSDGQNQYDSQSLHRPVSYRFLVSFG